MKREELKDIIKECIVEIKEDNEALSEGFLDRFKKKKESNKNNSTKRRELTKEEIDEMEKDYDELLSTIKKVISKMKNTSDYKNLCKECCEKYNKYCGYDNEVKNDRFVPKLIVDDYETIGGSDLSAIIEIIDEDQMVRTYFGDILYMIVKLLKEWFPDIHKKFKYNYGDGDEGCLYIKYKKEFE